MKTPEFSKRFVFTSGSLVIGTACSRKLRVSAGTEPGNRALSESGITMIKPAREIPVLAETDVLVIGGGPAGTAAAIAASRTGAETFLVERYNHLGGLWTGGLVLPLLSTHAVDKNHKTRQVIYGVGGEMSQRLKDLGMSVGEVNPVVDPEAAKYVLDEMIIEAGVKMLYHTWAANVIMEGSTVRGVFMESKSAAWPSSRKLWWIAPATGISSIGPERSMMRCNITLAWYTGWAMQTGSIAVKRDMSKWK